jgi:predicted RNA-binding Zn-ribbon protein involved in translation (DUF1610 family)
MKAYEKFENALKDHRLYKDWVKQGECGRIGTETATGIVIFVNEGEDDTCSMFQFPPIKEMQEDDAFRLKALDEFCDHEDTKFVYNLCRWVARPSHHECPLFPVDVYFLWDSPIITDFEDDVEEEPKNDETTEEYCPHCDVVVDLSIDFKVQKCPNCGKWLVPCSLCPLQNCSKHCPLERHAIILNGESKE